ncbi:MAG: hypothetical protein P4N59_22890 [Negativicutes bacterium]|nr:hypothetical protein [Negativicutes bacterium]
MKNEKSLKALQVGATFAGTIIGAGFASGQEIAQFFTSYGPIGLAGVVLAGGLFGWLGGALLDLGHKLHAETYPEAIYHLCGRRFGLIIDLVTAAFLFTAVTVMLAGAATVLRDYFGVPYLNGLVAAALAIVLTVLYGVGGIVTANMVITPLLVLSILAISIYSLSYHDFDLSLLNDELDAITSPAPHWLLGSLLYVSYNLVIASTVLVPLGNLVADRKTRLMGGAIGGLTVGLLAMVIALVVLIHSPEILDYEVPFLELASNQNPLSSVIYAFTLLAAMYTTAIASLYGCLAKMRHSLRLPPVITAATITVAAIICGQAGFANLIRVLFPLFGYATLLFTARLAWLSYRDN